MRMLRNGAYVIKGQCRVTTIDPQDHSEVADFVWYVPRGHGHSIQGIGNEDCLFVLVFDNGYFSEFGTFSISDWIGHTPPEVLEKTFGVPAQTFASFPNSEVYIAKGPVPPPVDPAPGSLNSGALSNRYRLLAQRPESYPGGTNRLVSRREFPISTTMIGELMRIRAAACANRRWHPNADERQYYISGRARISVFGSHGRVGTEEFAAGDVGYVPQGSGHYIESAGSEELQLLIVLNDGSYRSISLIAWMASNPHLRLATNFRVSEAKFKDFPTREQFMPG
jgi:oxalate decarboxylase